MAKKSEYDTLRVMPVRSWRVTIQDLDGVSHTLEVTAATLYEAVAQGLAAIRGNEWVAGIAQGLSVVKVSVANVSRRARGQADGFHEVAIAHLEQVGSTMISARATDMASRTQPDSPEWNRLGYGNNAIQKARVDVR